MFLGDDRMENTMNALRAIVLVALVACSSAARGQPALTPQPFVSGLASPVEIAHAHDASGRLFIVEQGGRIRIVRTGVLQAAPFLDLSAANGGPVRTGGEQGLLGLAFHPSYITNGLFFVHYTRALAGDASGNEIVIARYARSAANPDIASPTGTVLLAIAHPQFANHNGGKLAFGPDGYLYIGVGDGGSANDPRNNAQNLSQLLGKILRIDVDGAVGYAIPPDNPFVGQAAARPEVWAYGLRNPWRFSFDRATGDLYIGDVGQNSIEEIDFVARGTPAGLNFGWRVFEGSDCRVWAAVREGEVWTAYVLVEPHGPLSMVSAFGEDEAGELYAASWSNHTIYAIEGPGPAVTNPMARQGSLCPTGPAAAGANAMARGDGGRCP